MAEKFETVDAYVASFGGKPSERVIEMRAFITSLLPNAVERISYNIPAYFVDGKMVVYFAGYDKHIGMYPGRTSDDAYNAAAAPYAHGASTTRFPHNEPLPVDIIERFIAIRLAEIS